MEIMHQKPEKGRFICCRKDGRVFGRREGGYLLLVISILLPLPWIVVMQVQILRRMSELLSAFYAVLAALIFGSSYCSL